MSRRLGDVIYTCDVDHRLPGNFALWRMVRLRFTSWYALLYGGSDGTTIHNGVVDVRDNMRHEVLR